MLAGLLLLFGRFRGLFLRLLPLAAGVVVRVRRGGTFGTLAIFLVLALLALFATATGRGTGRWSTIPACATIRVGAAIRRGGVRVGAARLTRTAATRFTCFGRFFYLAPLAAGAAVISGGHSEGVAGSFVRPVLWIARRIT